MAPQSSPKKTVLITGCSQGGLGDAFARAFHKQGLHVFATARNLAKVQHLKDLGIDILELEVTDVESCKRAAAVVEKANEGRGFDYLVNNSGIGMPPL